VWSFCYGSSCVLLRLVHAFRYGRLCGSSCIWAPILPTGLALHLGAPLANSPCLALGRPTLAKLLMCFVTALRAFGCPCCEVALRCIWAPILRTRLRCVQAPNLGEAVLKNLPPSQNWFLSVLRLVFLPSAPFVWSFSLRLFVRFVTAIRVFRYGSSCVWVPILPTGLALHLGAPLANSPCLALHLGAHLANSPCLAFGRPTLVRPY
jgi:hypothetical protein